MKKKQSDNILKKKIEPQLGYKAPNFFKDSKFFTNSRGQGFGIKSNTSFPTQHKGG